MTVDDPVFRVQLWLFQHGLDHHSEEEISATNIHMQVYKHENAHTNIPTHI